MVLESQFRPILREPRQRNQRTHPKMAHQTSVPWTRLDPCHFDPNYMPCAQRAYSQSWTAPDHGIHEATTRVIQRLTFPGPRFRLDRSHHESEQKSEPVDGLVQCNPGVSFVLVLPKQCASVSSACTQQSDDPRSSPIKWPRLSLQQGRWPHNPGGFQGQMRGWRNGAELVRRAFLPSVKESSKL